MLAEVPEELGAQFRKWLLVVSLSMQQVVCVL